ncbi:hypothetical protein [Niallia circulans]|uniref:hypothetical protein n=1 Tax=Niallia circulans TaxID=1397 RepID=UPI00156021AB|nr:hypothetical protein [Niallia circulans]NRG33223.1 hypothetical protein [Niallia circulans]
MITLEEIQGKTEEMLMYHYQTNGEFNKDFFLLNQYVRIHLEQFIETEKIKEYEEQLYTVSKSLLFNGYFIGMEILNNLEEIFKDNEIFEQSNANLKQQTFDMLRHVLGENIEDVLITEPHKKLTAKLVTEYENILPTLMNYAFYTTVLGVQLAFQDERNKREINIPNQNKEGGILANIEDTHFLFPDVFMNISIVNNNVEVWTITQSFWNAFDKIGDIFVAKNSVGDLYLNVIMKNSLSLVQRNMIFNQIEGLLKENYKTGKLIKTMAVVEEFFDIREENFDESINSED